MIKENYNQHVNSKITFTEVNYMNYLIVVDMQNDFVTGALGTKEAEKIVPNVKEKIRKFNGEIIFTRDTHQKNYLDTQEGKLLPVPHCIEGTEGFEIVPELDTTGCKIINKPTFGSKELGEYLTLENRKEKIESITLVGLCTDICIISNAMLIKAFLPEVPITVDSSCCAGVAPESHQRALESMKACQIQVI
jgi:nicotinamidase/pyrazinamidase